MKNCRILVLTSSTGGGHDARAYAFKAWMDRLYGNKVDVRIERVLENSSIVTASGVRIYNRIQQWAPILHNLFWWIVEAWGIIASKLWFVGHAYYKKLLLDYEPHVIFSVHDATNGVFFQIAKYTLKPEAVQCITYCGEFTGGFGYSRHWIAPSVDLFYSRTFSAQEYALKLGLPQDRAAVFQNILPPYTFLEREQCTFNRDEFRVKNLELKPEKFTVFLTTGSVGANSHLRLLAVLLEFSDRVQAIVVCGKNQALFTKVFNWRKENSKLNIHLEGYSTRMHQLIRASDVIVSRGGSNTATEALFFGCPIIFNCMSGVMPQERLTINFFIHRQAAIKIKDSGDFKTIISKWLHGPESYQKIRENFQALHRDDHPKRLIKQVMERAKQVQH